MLTSISTHAVYSPSEYRARKSGKPLPYKDAGGPDFFVP